MTRYILWRMLHLCALAAAAYLPAGCSGTAEKLTALSGSLSIANNGSYLPIDTFCAFIITAPDATYDIVLTWQWVEMGGDASCDTRDGAASVFSDEDGAQLLQETCWYMPTTAQNTVLSDTGVMLVVVDVPNAYTSMGLDAMWNIVRHNSEVSPSPLPSSPPSSSPLPSSSFISSPSPSPLRPSPLSSSVASGSPDPSYWSSPSPAVTARSSYAPATASAEASMRAVSSIASASPSPSASAAASAAGSTQPKASLSSSSSPLPTVTVTPFVPPQHATACIALQGTSIWQLQAPTTIITGAHADLAAALRVDMYRLTAFQYAPAAMASEASHQLAERSLSTAPPTLRFQIIDAITIGERSTAQIVADLQSQLNDPSAALWSGQITRGLSASFFQNSWSDPAAIAVTPAQLTFTLPHIRNGPPVPQLQSVTLRNSGGSSLVITSLSIQLVQNPYGSNVFALSNVGALPLVVNAGASISLDVTLQPAAVPTMSSTAAFAIVNLEHNVVNGIHAIPITLQFSGMPSPGPAGPAGDDESWSTIASSLGFKAGAGVAAGAILFASICCCTCYWCLKRRRSPRQTATPASMGGAIAPARQVKIESDSDSETADASRKKASTKRDKAGTKISYELPSDSESDTETAAQKHSPKRAASQSSGLELSSLSRAATTSATSSIMSSGLPSSNAGISFSGLTLGGSGPSSSPSSAQSSLALKLKAKPSLKASEFETKWSSLATVELWGATLDTSAATSASLPGSSGSDWQRTLAAHGIACMASGTVSGVTKYYFYAEEENSNRLCMAEVSVTLSSHRLSAVLKAADPAMGPAFTAIFKHALAPYIVPE